MVNKLPDTTNVLAKSQVTVSEFPTGVASEFPPYYKRSLMPKREKGANEVPVISLGRYGSVLRYYRPSDDAFFAMFTSAKKTIRMALQDLGPMQLPGTTIPVPGCVWPRKYLSAFGNAIWTRNVDVEIVLSNPGSNPGNLTPAETFGNGWTCVDVASEIIKAIRKVYPSATDAQLKKKLEKHLRICYLRRKSGTTWDDGVDTLGLHAKHFIIDDICTYIGSQNLYSCDLAEWGVFIDHVATVEKFKGEYWNPMWAASYTGQDCKVEDVMNGLEIDRGHYRWRLLSPSKRKVRHQAMAKPSRSFSMLG